MKIHILMIFILITVFSYSTYAGEPEKLWETHYDIDESFFWNVFEENMDGDQGWELAKDKDGVKVYVRTVKISKVKAFRGVIQIESDLSTLNAFFIDADHFPEWVGFCVFSAHVKKVSPPFDEYFYARVQPPWPVKARDSVAHHILVQDPETLTTTIKLIGVPDFCPRSKEKIIRCPLLLLKMKTIPIGNGKVEVHYEVVVEIGGWIPNWIINFMLKYAPYITLKKTRELLPVIHERYKGVSYSCIKEPSL